MNNFAKNIHSKFHKGCLNILNKAIKLTLPFQDILFLLFCYNQSFKSPFLDEKEFYTYIQYLPFENLMDDLFIARDLVSKEMCNELATIESHLTIWHKDAKIK